MFNEHRTAQMLYNWLKVEEKANLWSKAVYTKVIQG
jgi:hypothetical protein